MKLTLKSLDTKMQAQFAEVRAEMRSQFDEVHQRIDRLTLRFDALDESIDARLDTKLDARFAQFSEQMDAKLDARFSKFTADIIEGLSPWMHFMSTASDDHKTRITAIECSEVV